LLTGIRQEELSVGVEETWGNSNFPEPYRKEAEEEAQEVVGEGQCEKRNLGAWKR